MYCWPAKLVFNEMATKDHGFPGDMISTYTLFLHMLDESIRHRNASMAQKIAAADDLIYNVLINAQPRLHVLARYFFARRLDNLIKMQPGDANFHTSWVAWSHLRPKPRNASRTIPRE